MEGFFSNFPLVNYDFTNNTDFNNLSDITTNLTTRVVLNINPDDFAKIVIKYTITGNELPENISNRIYGTPDLAWTIIYINSIRDLSNEWPMSEIELVQYITNKYGTLNINTIKHYEKIPENIVMDKAYITSNYGSQYVNPITNYDYETRINDKKRYIYLVSPLYIQEFVKQYAAALAV